MVPGQVPAFASADIVVNGADIEGVILQPLAPATITGRLVGDPATLANLDPSKLRLMAAPAGPQMMAGPPPPPQPVGADLTFSIQAAPGMAFIRGVTPPLLIRSIRAEGRDIMRGIEIAAGGRLGDVEVEITTASAKLVVTALDGRGAPAADHDIVVFTQDEDGWGVPLPGHGATGRTNDDGTLDVSTLLPGAYYVALADDIHLDLGDANDPEILATLRARAQRITLGDGETATVSLRTGGR